MPSKTSKHSVNNHDLYELRILEHVEKSPRLNNRKASAVLGVSLKLAHDVLTTMVKKGLVSVTKHNSRRWDYHLTPAGIVQKGRLTYEFLDFSMHFFREARRDSALLCRRLAEAGKRRVSFVGAGNLAEITYLGVSEWGLSLEAVYDDVDGVFMQVPVQPLAQAMHDESEALIVCVYDAKHPMTSRYLPAGLQPLPHMVWPIGTKSHAEFVVAVEAGMGLTTPSGLALRDCAGRPLLAWGLDRLRSAGHYVVVSTSNHASDDPIAEYCLEHGIACSRGDLLNRAARLQSLLREHHASTLVRVNGLCPLLDPTLVTEAIAAYQAADCDLLSSALADSPWPAGLQLDVVDAEVFASAFESFSQPDDFSRLTSWFQRESADRISAFNGLSSPPGGGETMLVSSEADFQRLETLLAACDDPHAPWRTVAGT